jgi:competence protein ComGC
MKFHGKNAQAGLTALEIVVIILVVIVLLALFGAISL